MKSLRLPINEGWRPGTRGDVITPSYGPALRGANLYRATLSGADLHSADLIQATLTLAALRGASLIGATLSAATADDAIFHEADLSSGKTQRGSPLRGRSPRCGSPRSEPALYQARERTPRRLSHLRDLGVGCGRTCTGKNTAPFTARFQHGCFITRDLVEEFAGDRGGDGEERWEHADERTRRDRVCARARRGRGFYGNRK